MFRYLYAFLIILPFSSGQWAQPGGVQGAAPGQFPAQPGAGRGQWRQMAFERMIAQLPPQVQAQARAIHANTGVNWLQRRAQMMKLWDTLPVQQRPMPRFFQRLPPTVQQQIQGIWGQTNLPWSQRQQQMRQLMQSLPADQRPQMPIPRFVNRLPEPYRSQWLAIRNDVIQPGKLMRFKQLVQSMPQEVKNQLPMQGQFRRFGGMGGGFAGQQNTIQG